MRPAARHLERLLGRLGFRGVAGVDEAGMGPLAGPVVAAAVILPTTGRVPAVADSKTLRPTARAQLARSIRRSGCAVGVGVVEPPEIDRLNIYHAGIEAMRRALARLPEGGVDFVLVDGREIGGLEQPQAAFPKADSFVASVAAASIIAKVARDGIMTDLDHTYPAYGFAKHMGYPTPAHLAALGRHGPCPAHRRSFAPVAFCELRGEL